MRSFGVSRFRSLTRFNKSDCDRGDRQLLKQAAAVQDDEVAKAKPSFVQKVNNEEMIER